MAENVKKIAQQHKTIEPLNNLFLLIFYLWAILDLPASGGLVLCKLDPEYSGNQCLLLVRYNFNPCNLLHHNQNRND